MDEKNIWIVLFVSLLAICIIMTVFLVRNAGGLDCKQKYDDLRGKYAELATKHKNILNHVLTMKTNLASNAASTGSDGKKGIEQLQKEVDAQQKNIEGLQAEVDAIVSEFEGKDEAIRNRIVELTIQSKEYGKKQ